LGSLVAGAAVAGADADGAADVSAGDGEGVGAVLGAQANKNDAAIMMTKTEPTNLVSFLIFILRKNLIHISVKTALTKYSFFSHLPIQQYHWFPYYSCIINRYGGARNALIYGMNQVLKGFCRFLL
jgi:hypothetical protein